MLETTTCSTSECDSVGGNAMLKVALVATTACEEEYTVIVTASDITAKGETDAQTTFNIHLQTFIFIYYLFICSYCVCEDIG